VIVTKAVAGERCLASPFIRPLVQHTYPDATSPDRFSCVPGVMLFSDCKTNEQIDEKSLPLLDLKIE
jgi:hypothetical protein